MLDKMLRSHKRGIGSARIQVVWLQRLSSYPVSLKAKIRQIDELSLGSVAVVGTQRWIYQEAGGLNPWPLICREPLQGPGGPSSVNTWLCFCKFFKIIYFNHHQLIPLSLSTLTSHTEKL